MRPIDLGKIAAQMDCDAAPVVLCMGGYVFVNPAKATKGSLIREQLEQRVRQHLLVAVEHGYGKHVEIYHSVTMPEPVSRQKQRSRSQLFQLKH